MFGVRPTAARMSLPSMRLRAGGRAHGERHILSGSAVHAKCLGRHETIDPFVAEDPLHLLRDVGILLAEQV